MHFTAGSSQYLREAVANWRSTDNVGTIMAWIKRDAIGVQHNIFASSNEGGTTNYLWFGITATNYLSVNARLGGGDLFNQVRGGTTISADQWYHVALLTDGSVWSLFVNGQSEDITVVVTGNSGDWFGDIALRDNVCVGAEVNSGGAINEFDGSIRKVEVFSEAKAASFIARRHAAERKFF